MWSQSANLFGYWVEVQNVTNFHFPSVTGIAQLVVLATCHNSLTVLLPCASPGPVSRSTTFQRDWVQLIYCQQRRCGQM